MLPFETESGPPEALPFEEEGLPFEAALMPEEKSTLWEDVQSGVLQAGKSLTTGVLGASAGLASLFGASDEFIAPFFEQQKRTEEFLSSLDPAKGKKQGISGKIASGVAQLPGWLGPQAAFSISGLATQRGQSAIEEGATTETALGLYGVSAATNAALLAIPASVRGDIISRILSGAGIGAATTYLEPEMINEIRKAYGLKEIPKPEFEDYAANMVFGGTLGAALGPKAQNKVDNSIVLENLDPELKPTPEELAIDAQQVRGAQYGGKNALGVEFPELRGQSAFPLELLPEDQYPVSDRGTRTKDSVTGKTVQGMAEEVPTIDFPLRQEVLQQPEIQEAIDKFRLEAERLRQAGDEAGLARLESGFMSGMRQLGIYKPQDAIGLQKLWESVSRGDEPALRYPEGIRKSGEIDTKLTETDIPAIVDEQSKNLYKVAKLKKQSGAIDPEVFKEGFKLLAKALSNLTDKTWLKEKFPSDKWMTNSDGTTLVMLHGTEKVFDAFSDLQMGQGLHAGFAVPSHLIRISGEESVLPKRILKERRKSTPHKREYPFNIRPIVIKRGKYPFIEMDFGDWHPSNLLLNNRRIPHKGHNFNTFYDLLHYLSLENNKSPLTLDRFNWYKKEIENAWNNAESNRLFTSLLNEVGIDGFFYINTGETLLNRGAFKYGDKVQHPVSFVTWNKDNVRSIYDHPEPTFVPKYQRGAIDPDLLGIGKLAEKIKGKFTTELAKSEHQTAAFERLPIGRTLKDAMIPENVSVEQVKIEALEVPDTTPGYALVGGSHMLSEIKNHPIVYAATQWFNNAGKRAQFLIRENLHPVEEALNKTLQKQGNAELLYGIFMKELKADRRFSVEELRNAGANEQVIQTYDGLRQAFDLAHKAQNETLISLGKKPLTFREAYFASRWGGNWRTPVYNKAGKVVWYIAEPTKGRAEAALAHLAQNYPDLDINKSKVTYRPSRSGEKGDSLVAGYYEMLKLLDPEDPRVGALKSIYEDFIAAEGERTLGQTKHFEPKTGVRGFIGDRPWAKNDIKEMFKQQVKYMQNAFTWSEMQKAVAKSKQIFSDPDLIEKAPNAITLGKEIAKNRLGFGELEVVTAIENAVAEALGVSPSTLAKTIDYPRMFFYWTKLGFMNVPYTAVSLIQPLYTIPWHMKLSSEGFSHNPIVTFHRGMLDALGLLLEHEGVQNITMTDLGRKAAEYGIDNGIIDITTMSDVANLGRPEIVQSVEKAITFNMMYSERLARSVAFMHFVHHLDQSGAFKGREIEMFQRAEELTNLSMADYRVHERAPIFNKLGLSGSALSTLNTFKINQFNQLYKLAKDAHKTGNYMPLLSLMAIQFAMGGAMGFFAINTIDQAWEYFKSLLPDKQWMKVKDVSIKEALIKTAIENPDKSWMVYGGLSALTGINMSSRYDAGTIVEPTLEGILPFVADLGNQLQKVWQLAMDPASPVKQAQATYAVLPTSLKGLYEASSDVFYDEKTGIASQVSDPLQGVYRRTPQEQTMRKFGVTGLEEAKQKELKFRMATKEGQRKERLRSTSEKLKEAVIFGTPERVGELYMRYIELNGTVPDLGRMFGEAFVRRMSTKLEQMQMKVKTPAGAKRYEEYVR